MAKISALILSLWNVINKFIYTQKAKEGCSIVSPMFQPVKGIESFYCKKQSVSIDLCIVNGEKR
jgi:hypothetical protein